MSSRRNIFIRAIGTLAGDLAVGIALASACTWVIQTAALGVFLAFVLWLLAVVASLAVSQHVVHPVAKALLSDRRLDDGIAAAQSLARELARFAQGSSTPPWDFMRSSFGRYTAGFTSKAFRPR
ncbi:MAG: hypothetical protein IPF94_06200 [Betaproteobacteria bacterium]|nr:hypothetical protein [Betaproteobacteria bacterium]